MRRTLLGFLMAVIGMLAFSLPLQAAVKFTVDEKHSYVPWHINHLSFSTQAGKLLPDLADDVSIETGAEAYQAKP